MMDKIVMEIMIPATLQADPGVAKRRYVTVVHREGIKRSLDAIGHRKIVVIIVAGASLTERFPVMFHIPLRIGTLNPKSCDAHARTQGTDQYRCIQSIADQNGSQGTIGTPVSGQNDPFRNFQHKLIDVNKSGQIDYMLIRDIHYIPRLRLLQCFDQSTEVADFKITPG